MAASNTTLKNVKLYEIMRTARKSRGLSQQQVADFLNINQATLSRFESGKLTPSVIEWFTFCSSLNIDAHKSYVFGYIDNLKKFHNNDYDQNSFKMNKKYFAQKNIKIREIVPLWKLITQSFENEIIKNFIKAKKIDTDIFNLYDISVSFRLFTDLIYFIEQNSKDLLNEFTSMDLFRTTTHRSEIENQLLNTQKHDSFIDQIVSYNSYYNRVLSFIIKTNRDDNNLIAKLDDTLGSQYGECDLYIDYKINLFKLLLPETVEVFKSYKNIEFKLTV